MLINQQELGRRISGVTARHSVLSKDGKIFWKDWGLVESLTRYMAFQKPMNHLLNSTKDYYFDLHNRSSL